MDDADLIRLALGDADAFERIYRRYAPRVERWLRQELDSQDLAAEIVAETFAQLLISSHRFRGRGDVSATAWIDGIARNILRSYRRKGAIEARARRRLGIQREVEVVLEARDAPGSSDAERALVALPEHERQAIELHVVDEMSYAEISEALSLPAAAIRQRVSRGLRSIRTQLGGTDT
jgi:RNA polymerase sigma-70 factor (ECF subfamily)